MTTYLTDNFTGTNGAALTAHTPDTGSVTYTNITGDLTLNGSGFAVNNNNSDIEMGLSGTLPSINFSWEADAILNSGVSDNTVLALRLNESVGTNLYYVQILNRGTSRTVALYRYVSGTPTTVATDTGTITQGNNYTTRIEASDSGGNRTIKCLFGAQGGSLTQLWSYTDTSPLSGTALRFDLADVGGSPLVKLDAFRIVDLVASMTCGNLGDTVVTGLTSATVLCPTPVNNASTVTYEWHMSTTVNFTASGANLSGGTSQTGSFTGLTARTKYWVCCIVSDGTTTITTAKRLVYVSGQPGLILLIVGDSTERTVQGVDDTTTASAPPEAVNMLQAQYGARQVILVNAAVAGSASTHWTSGSTNMNAALALLATAKASYPGLQSICTFNLGANDAQAAVSSSTFLTNVTSGLSALAGNVDRTTIEYPGWREPGVDFESQGITFDETYTTYVESYFSVIDGLVNRTTVFAGDTYNYIAQASRPASLLHGTTTFPGAIHPSTAGAVVRGALKAFVVTQVSTLPVKAVWNGTGFDVSWSSIPAAKQYKVYRGATTGADSTLLTTVTAPTVTYTDSSPGSNNFYEIEPVY